jgi:hypothetical protein
MVSGDVSVLLVDLAVEVARSGIGETVSLPPPDEAKRG